MTKQRAIMRASYVAPPEALDLDPRALAPYVYGEA
jgi:hypothetical protein